MNYYYSTIHALGLIYFDSSATFTLYLWQSLLRPPWTKRGDREATWENGNDIRSSPWSPWTPGQIFKLSKNLLRQPRRDWPTLCAIVERVEGNRTWQDVIYLNTTWSMSVTRREARASPGTSRSFKFCYGLPRLNARLAISAPRQLHVSARFATLSYRGHGELRWIVAVSSSLATVLHGVLRFTCRSTTVRHSAQGLGRSYKTSSQQRNFIR